MYFTDTKYYIFLFKFSLLFISSSVLHFMDSSDTFLASIICYRSNWFLMRSLYLSIVMKTQVYPVIIETHCVSIQSHSSQGSLYLWQIPYSLIFGSSEYCPTMSPVPCMEVQFLSLLLQYFPFLEDFGDYFLQFLQFINSKYFNYHTDKECFKHISLELFDLVPLNPPTVLHERNYCSTVNVNNQIYNNLN